MWDKRISNGVLKRVIDEELTTLVYEFTGTNVSTNFLCAPVDQSKSLGIEYPCMTLIVKAVSTGWKFAWFLTLR